MMNLFGGMTKAQIVSAILAVAVFGLFVLLEAAALTAFYITSRPRRGRVRTAALWHAVAAIWFLLSIISTVWAAPAEKSFLTTAGNFGVGDRMVKLFVGAAFAAVGIACMLSGGLVGARQARGLERDAARGVEPQVHRGAAVRLNR